MEIFVLMVNLAIGGGFSAEFFGLEACQSAGKAYMQRMDRHQQSWFLCEPKKK